MRKQQKRRKVEFIHLVATHISQKKYDELQEMLGKSTLNTMSELLRNILENRKITLEYYDTTLDKVMLELCEHRREIQSIGLSINEVTQRFHIQKWPEAMLENAQEIAGSYQRVDLSMQKLFDLIAKIAKKWLPD